MGITKTLYTGVTGLTAHGEALGVVGDNIANVNTTGYKSERVIFSDLLGRSMMSLNAAGSGVMLQKISRVFAQGTLLTTESPTDLAINGRGFFVLRGQLNGVAGNYFSRAGQFTLDKNGNMVNPSGFILQGYLVNTSGEMDNQLNDLQVADSVLPPLASTAVELSTNLDSNATVLGAGLPWSTTSPGTTSNFSTAITVYDSLGDAHRLDVYFRKIQDANPAIPQYAEWDYHVLVDGGELQGGATGTAVEMATGTLEFTADGWLWDETTTLAWGVGSTNFVGASAQAISFDFGININTDGGSGQAGSTNYATASSIRSQEQNGYSTGELSGIGVQGDGNVMAVYSNGEQRFVGQVALATFEAEEELARAGESLWWETQASGNARIGPASSGSAGAITAGALEQSTVDLAGEFVKLIAYQRGFQANSRTITIADQLYQEIVNLKR